jgi:putative redox protein
MNHPTSIVRYQGNLRTACEHLQSGTTILTDAPTDNKGKGEAFSPTDLVATALASCMFTIMGIYCQEHGLEFVHGEATVHKIMSNAPRRIEKVVVELDLNGNNWSDAEMEKVKRAGLACPVTKTLDGNVMLEFKFK